jgi:hypothetical protein
LLEANEQQLVRKPIPFAADRLGIDALAEPGSDLEQQPPCFGGELSGGEVVLGCGRR